ncbi:MAG: Tfp pilus assembly protein FimT/FimU [Longimicrobiales bacterium]
MLVLGFLGVSLATAVPRFQDARDRIAVRAAREAVIGFLSRARYHAVLRGGAEVLVSEPSQTVALTSAAGVVETLHLSRDYGVELAIEGGTTEVGLRFDGLGLGRVTSRTFLFRRGTAVSRVVLSSYGRARRAS